MNTIGDTTPTPINAFSQHLQAVLDDAFRSQDDKIRELERLIVQINIPVEPVWMTSKQAAEHVGGVSVNTLTRWIRETAPEIRRIADGGNVVRYHRADLDEMMERRFPKGDEGVR